MASCTVPTNLSASLEQNCQKIRRPKSTVLSIPEKKPLAYFSCSVVG